jgi:anti-sigma factor RsiW
MKSNTHLTEIDLMEAASGTRGVRAEHLEACASCRGEVEEFRRSLQNLRSSSVAASDRDADFWLRQHAAIRGRIEGREVQPSLPRLAWACAVALLIVSCVLLRSGPTPIQHAQTDPDHELLIEVERAVQSGGLEALEPASPLTQEVARNSANN